MAGFSNEGRKISGLADPSSIQYHLRAKTPRYPPNTSYSGFQKAGFIFRIKSPRRNVLYRGIWDVFQEEDDTKSQEIIAT